jgi:hypothetical protein
MVARTSQMFASSAGRRGHMRYKLVWLLLLTAPAGSGTAFGQSPVAAVSPGTLTFPPRLVGLSSAPQSITVTNIGSGPLTLSSITISGQYANAYSIQPGSSCVAGLTLSPEFSCRMALVFTPLIADGPFFVSNQPASVVISDNAANSPQSVTLGGIGTASPAYFSSAQLLFGSAAVGISFVPSTLTLTNTGSGTLHISNVATSGDYMPANSCPLGLSPGAQCTIQVTFFPTGTGTRLGWLTVTDDANDSPQNILLVGTGSSGGILLSNTSLPFGNQAMGTKSAAQAVTLTNNGASPLSVISILARGDYSQTNNCPASISPGAKCKITVTFTPTWSGSRPGAITITHTAAGFLQTIALSGTGLAPTSTVALNTYQASLTPGQTLQFQATVQGPSQNVTWSVDGIAGGNPSVGTISSSGLYISPPTSGLHHVAATSIANPTQTATAAVATTNYAGTFTYHNDSARTGQNLAETALTNANVNSTQFGKLFSYAVDGYVYAQPLYVESVNLPGVGVRNVIYVATEHDSIYAFDADGLSGTPYWQASFINSPGVTSVPNSVAPSTVEPEVGITSTPVIDPIGMTLYVVANTLEGSSVVYRLHALDITTGAEKFGGPIVIQAVVRGNGQGTTGGFISFNSVQHGQRTGLLLSNGVVYAGFADRGPDTVPWHGWLLGYNATTLQQVGVFNSTPNGGGGGVWESGDGPAVDASGNIYLSTGNGTFDAAMGGPDYGDSVIKFNTTGGGLNVADYFSPFDQAYLARADQDLASGGLVVLPDQPGPLPHLVIAASKAGAIYLVDRDNMGKFHAGADVQIVQAVRNALNTRFYSTPAYWQNHLYHVSVTSFLQEYLLYDGLLTPTPVAVSSAEFNYPGTPAISSKGTASANAIVWLLDNSGWTSSSPAVLHAWDASNIGAELYNSNQAGARDTPGPAVKFAVPTVANGKVYVSGQKQLTVYGLLPQIRP